MVQEGCKRVMVVTDRGIENAGLLGDGLKSLREAGIDVTIYKDVVPDPTEKNVYDATMQAEAQGIDGVIGFGGGSSMDVAKLVAYMKKNSGTKLDDIYGVGNAPKSRLPLIQVPTTAGTGSEVTPISIITTGATSKMGIVSASLLPDWAVLDGNITLTVPKATTAHTGVDAMVHAIEAYTSKFKKNQLSDLLAREALKILSANIHTAVHDGQNA